MPQPIEIWKSDYGKDNYGCSRMVLELKETSKASVTIEDMGIGAWYQIRQLIEQLIPIQASCR